MRPYDEQLELALRIIEDELLGPGTFVVDISPSRA